MHNFGDDWVYQMHIYAGNCVYFQNISEKVLCSDTGLMVINL